jgi:hypothetical protein
MRRGFKGIETGKSMSSCYKHTHAAVHARVLCCHYILSWNGSETKSYAPKNTAPPNEIHIVRGTTPANNALTPSCEVICARRVGIDRTEAALLEAPSAFVA